MVDVSLYVWIPMSDFWWWMSDVWHPMSGVSCLMCDVWCPMADVLLYVWRLMSDVWVLMSDVLTQIYSKTRVYWNYLSQSIWKFQQRQPIPTHYLPEMLRLILKENFFHFSGKHYLQNHGTAVGTRTAVLIPLPIFSWHVLKQQL